MTYKKNISDLSSVKNLAIYYNCNVGGGSLYIENSKTKPLEQTYKIKGGGSGSSSGLGGILDNPDKTIIVNIDVDGQKQTI